jgi:hypothetical protein
VSGAWGGCGAREGRRGEQCDEAAYPTLARGFFSEGTDSDEFVMMSVDLATLVTS